MTGWIGTSGGRKEIAEMWVGTATGRKQVEKAWVGTPQGNKVWYERVLPITLTATSDRWDRVQLSWTNPGGGVDSYKVYRGSTQIYSGALLTFTDTALDPSTAYSYRVEALRAGVVMGQNTASRTTPALSMAPMTATAVSASQVDCTWVNPGGLTAVRLRDSNGGLQTLAAAATSGSVGGLPASTGHNFAVDGVRDAQRWDNLGLCSASTPAPPPPQYETREWARHASWSASYNGSGNRRTDTTDCYYGYYSSNHGTQRSLAGWSIPDEIRNAHSIDAVKLQWWNQHTFPNGGTSVSLVGHHWGSMPGTFGATGALTHDNGAQVAWSAPKGGWIGDDPDDYFNVGWLRAPYGGNNRTVAEEIRYAGLQGFGLVAAVGGQDGYGYAGNDPILYIRYTVRVA